MGGFGGQEREKNIGEKLMNVRLAGGLPVKGWACKKFFSGGVEDRAGAEGIVFDAETGDGADAKFGVVVEDPVSGGIDDLGNGREGFVSAGRQEVG